MKTLLIGYDLNAPGRDYNDLIEHLETYPQWWHYLDSTWLIKTSEAPSAVRDRIGKFLDANDELLVLDVTSAPAAWQGFEKRPSEWIKSNL